MPYVVGIDLGTTNSVVAYTPLEVEQPDIQVLPIPQLVAPGVIESREALPSFVYLAGEHDAGSSALDLPWRQGNDVAVGELARRQAADLPEQTVAAAKSWLAHSRVDRHEPILPWGVGSGQRKISPVDAARTYLEHLVAAWNQSFPDDPLAEQKVVLTVPASFDASARELTREAARAAGLPEDFRLLEEPQAAVYAWLDETGDRWRKTLAVGDRLLVCDVGGGTTDFTLVGVEEEDGELALQRIAVGNHLLVGGDNMDLTLAHLAAGLFQEQGHALDPWQSVALWHSCRNAKETLLAASGPPTQTIAVAGRGSRLIAKSVSIEMDAEQVSQLLLDGFFPQVGPEERPVRQRASGFQEIGLPFESDTAITRHLAAFLAAHESRPTRVLLNGGVFKAERLSERLMSVLSAWSGDSPPSLLQGRHDLDNAVARGAAHYGWSKQQGGVRIRGGTARAYYVGIETSGLAIPGMPRPLRALCVAPIGMEEGSEADVPSQEIGLVVGEPAQFRFFSSPERKADQPGDLLPNVDGAGLTETDSLEATLSADEEINEPYVPVRFQSHVTELGVFELWCVSQRNDRRWKLEFSVREE